MVSRDKTVIFLSLDVKNNKFHSIGYNGFTSLKICQFVIPGIGCIESDVITVIAMWRNSGGISHNALLQTTAYVMLL